jgi:hypothetical protein
METSDTRNYVPTVTSIPIPIPNSVGTLRSFTSQEMKLPQSENLSCSLIPFKEKMKIFINLNKQQLMNLIN